MGTFFWKKNKKNPIFYTFYYILIILIISSLNIIFFFSSSQFFIFFQSIIGLDKPTSTTFRSPNKTAPVLLPTSPSATDRYVLNLGGRRSSTFGQYASPPTISRRIPDVNNSLQQQQKFSSARSRVEAAIMRYKNDSKR